MAVDKQKQELNRAIWSAGKWDEVADYVAGVGPGLLEAVGVEAGMRVLDVGTGSGGSVAIPAAKLGADVVGSDISQVHSRRLSAATYVGLGGARALADGSARGGASV